MERTHGRHERHRNYPRAELRVIRDDPVGAYDIGALAEVSNKAVYNWLAEELLPPADGPDVNGAPTWRRITVLRWLVATNRANLRVTEERNRMEKLYADFQPIDHAPTLNARGRDPRIPFPSDAPTGRPRGRPKGSGKKDSA